MTQFSLSPQLKDELLGKIPGVVQEGQDVYFQYDRITIDPYSGKVEFFYKGKHMFSMYGPVLTPGDVMTLSGVEGRMAAHLVS